MSVRLPHGMIAQLKAVGKKLKRPYQAVMKEAIQAGLPITSLSQEVLADLKALGKKHGRPFQEVVKEFAAILCQEERSEGSFHRNIRTYEAPHVEETIARLRGKMASK